MIISFKETLFPYLCAAQIPLWKDTIMRVIAHDSAHDCVIGNDCESFKFLIGNGTLNDMY